LTPEPDRQALEESEDGRAARNDIEKNVKAIGALRERADGHAGTHQLFIESVTSALGRPRTIYLVVLGVLLWAGANAAALDLGVAPIDPPPFFWMQGCLTLLSLLMTTMVLTTQNRQVRHNDQRAHLDLQVNLLAEQKIAKTIALLEELRRDIPSVANREDPVAEAMTKAVDPSNVVTALEDDSALVAVRPLPRVP